MPISNIVEVNDTNKKTSVLQLKKHVAKGHCFVFLHMKSCPYTIPFYDIWDKVKADLSKIKDLTTIEVDSDVIMYIKNNHNEVYEKLTSFYPNESVKKIYFPTFLFFKNGEQHKLTNRIDARIEDNKIAAYEQLLSFALLWHYRSDDAKKQKQSKSSNRTTRKNQTLRFQINEAFNKMLV